MKFTLQDFAVLMLIIVCLSFIGGYLDGTVTVKNNPAPDWAVQAHKDYTNGR